jgi:putative addiction module killer protein
LQFWRFDVTITIEMTDVFRAWVRGLRDRRAQARIDGRLTKVAMGLFGDVEPVGGDISELRIDYGTGYRLYSAQRGSKIILLLCGDDKSSQRRDIADAKALWLQLKE